VGFRNDQLAIQFGMVILISSLIYETEMYEETENGMTARDRMKVGVAEHGRGAKVQIKVGNRHCGDPHNNKVRQLFRSR